MSRSNAAQARRLAPANEDIGRVASAGEARLQALLTQEVTRLDAALQARGSSQELDAVRRELAALQAATARRLDAAEQGHALTVAALRTEMAERVERLAARLEQVADEAPGRAQRLRSNVAAAVVLALAVMAAGASLTAAAFQILARAPATSVDGAVRLELPLRPTLPATLPSGGAAAPQDRRALSAPRRAERALDYRAVAEAAAKGEPGALARIVSLAEGGLAAAQLHLAKLYEDGAAGAPRDLGQARRWTERAAHGGDRAAMYNLAVYMMKGEGGPPDAPSAARWFRKAAEAGVVDAQYNLGLMLESGRGVARNLPEAYRWYSVAANAGDGLARARAVALEDRLTTSEQVQAAADVRAFQPGAGPARSVAPVIAPAATLAESQKLLAREGYFIGPTDGADSPAYRAAAADYLRDHPRAVPPPASP